MKFIGNPVEVDAFVITEVGNFVKGRGLALSIDREKDSIVFATSAMISRMIPEPGDYWVVQSDGYEYINPKAVFERKYSPMPTDYLDLRRQIGDFRSIFYGPHKCQWCDALVIKQAADQGGVAWILIKGEGAKYMVHQEVVKVERGTTMSIVGVNEAKSVEEIAHCIASARAYGNLSLGFMDHEAEILEALKKAVELSKDSTLLALEESVKLQSHYAVLLNDYDGGGRMQFPNAAAWIARLQSLKESNGQANNSR